MAEELPEQLLWLADAPMFIDSKQVDAFYDAVVRPDYEGISIQESDALNTTTTFGGKVTVGAAIPWFVKAEGELAGEEQMERQRGQQRTLTPVSNAYRHLLALALHYALHLKKRLVLAEIGFGADPTSIETADKTKHGQPLWKDPAFVTDLPRALVFLDLPPGSKFIPAALELTSGEIVLLFDAFEKALKAPKTQTAPSYPGSQATDEARNEYWQWFAEKFDDPQAKADRYALEVVERAVQGEHSLAWIDYRVPLSKEGPPFLHLHVAGRGEYDTGTFAYQLITRGFKHGLRVVGTLKSEPDMNVLALFER
jgi:hypothetical protein